MKNIRRISLTLAALLCTAGMFAVPTDTQAAKNVLPSLFCNDEEWYKDKEIYIFNDNNTTEIIAAKAHL